MLTARNARDSRLFAPISLSATAVEQASLAAHGHLHDHVLANVLHSLHTVNTWSGNRPPLQIGRRFALVSISFSYAMSIWAQFRLWYQPRLTVRNYTICETSPWNIFRQTAAALCRLLYTQALRSVRFSTETRIHAAHMARLDPSHSPGVRLHRTRLRREMMSLRGVIV